MRRHSIVLDRDQGADLAVTPRPLDGPVAGPLGLARRSQGDRRIGSNENDLASLDVGRIRAENLIRVVPADARYDRKGEG